MDEIQKEVKKLKEHMAIIEEDIEHFEVISIMSIQVPNLAYYITIYIKYFSESVVLCHNASDWSER